MVTLAERSLRRPSTRVGLPIVGEPPAPRSTQGVIVAIPALNEERFVGRVIREVRDTGFECIVVDDGSTDRTGEVALHAGATVLRHPITLGQGAALQTGIEWALAHDADVIVTFDGDGQHRAREIARLVEALADGEADYALGSRFLGATINLPRTRRLLLKAATRFTRVATGLAVTDTHNGFRAMTRRGATAIHLHQNGMAHASEILHQIARSDLRWVEVPVTIEYNPETLAKGQRFDGFLAILLDLLMGRLQR